MVTVLNQIYEEDFLGFSYGFRPGRSQHQALDALWVGMMWKKVNWILDADVCGFFDNLSHEWLVKFIEHRVADRGVLRLIRKWLRAGVSEDGEWAKTEVGTPQGAVASPLLANIYLHYVFDLWVRQWRKRHATGDVIVVRYADDIVAGFEHRTDAERFLEEWKDRLQKFGLELHPDKTRLIEFRRPAAEHRKQQGEGKPEVLDFLGLTHICGKTRKTGRFMVKRKTIQKRLSAKLSEVKRELQRRWHVPVVEVGAWLRSVVQGYFNYHAVPEDRRGLNQGVRMPRAERFGSAFTYLVSTNRPIGGEHYKRLEAGLDRLKGTNIKPNIVTGGVRIKHAFGLIDDWKIIERSPSNERMIAVEVTLSEWLYNAVAAREVLTLNRDYFRLGGALERRLYELARNPGAAPNLWTLGLDWF
mgnify:CR=1 FL=1